MSWIAAHRVALLVVAVAMIVGVGGGLVLAPTSTRTVTLGSITPRTVTRTVIRTRTFTRSAASRSTPRLSVPAQPHGLAAPAASGPPSPPGAGTGGATELRYAGTGPRVLGTIIVRHESTLRWTSSAGRFRLFYDHTGVAVDSTAQSGQTGVPAMTYVAVKVEAAGHWTIRIG